MKTAKKFHPNFLLLGYAFILRLILRIFFRLLYHEMAWTYDWVAATVSAGHWDEWVLQAVPFVQGEKVLEIGFGPGRLQSVLAAAGKQVCGIDRSRQMVKLAKSRLKSKNPGDQLHGYAQSTGIVHGDGKLLPFKTSSFHTVIATFPTEYIFDRSTAAEITRVLCPGGRLVIILSAWITGKTLRERIAALLFSLTGQSEPWTEAWQTPFSARGLHVETRWIDLGHSRVCVLTAEKLTAEHAETAKSKDEG